MSKIEKVLLKYQTYLKETCKECLFYPYLLVQGEAGIGKSHLLAHLSKKLRDENHIIYLFLGQFFTKNEDPWRSGGACARRGNLAWNITDGMVCLPDLIWPDSGFRDGQHGYRGGDGSGQ